MGKLDEIGPCQASVLRVSPSALQVFGVWPAG